MPARNASPHRRRVVVAVAASVAGLAGVAGLLVWASFAASAERARLAASPTPTPYSVPVASETEPAGSDVVAKLPAGICGKLDRALVPAEVRAQKPSEVEIEAGKDQTCLWQIYEPRRSRYLTVAVEAVHNDDSALTLADAEDKFADTKDYAADTAVNHGYHADPQDIGELGDEAFGDKARSIITVDDVRYVIAGAQVVVRTGNVIVKVNWQGADYPEHSNVKTLRGDNLTYEQSRQVGVALAEEAMRLLR